MYVLLYIFCDNLSSVTTQTPNPVLHPTAFGGG